MRHNSGFIDIHPALEQVRRLPEFQAPAPTWLETLQQHPFFQHFSRQFDHMLQRMMDAFAHLFSRMALPAIAARIPAHIQDVFNVLLGFLTVLLLSYLLYLLLGMVLQGHEHLARWQYPLQRPDGTIASSKTHWTCAQQATRTGDYAEGIRQLYLATIFRLDESGWVPFEASRSNGEYQKNAFPIIDG